jgi:hypothetical protein
LGPGNAITSEVGPNLHFSYFRTKQVLADVLRFRRLQPSHPQKVFGIPRTLDVAEIGGRELGVDSAKVFFEAVQFRGTGDGNNPRLLRQGERNLSWGRLPLGRQCGQSSQQGIGWLCGPEV